MAFKIVSTKNGSTPNQEKIRLKATTAMNTKGFALVDKTFDDAGNLSNEFRHIYLFPDLQLAANEIVIVFSGKGKNGKKQFTDSDGMYHALFWGSDHCVWNDGGDTVTLINYVVVESKLVPAIENK